MSGAIFSLRLPYKVRCNLPDCGKPVHLVFKMQMDGMTNTFCSPSHANVGMSRWEQKKKLDLKPGQTLPLIEEDKPVADNMENIQEEVN